MSQFVICNDASKVELWKLYARYSSVEKYAFDVENVLFYNVGNKAFSHLYIRHLHFERVFEKAEHQEKDKNYPHVEIVIEEDTEAEWSISGELFVTL